MGIDVSKGSNEENEFRWKDSKFIIDALKFKDSWLGIWEK